MFVTGKVRGITATMSSAEMKSELYRTPEGEMKPADEAMPEWESYFEALDSVGMKVYAFDPGFAVSFEGANGVTSIPVSVAKKIKALYDRVKELENEQAR